MKFTKMHGIGNDYIYVNCFEEPFPDDPAALAVRLSDRHFGVGSDGVIFICPSETADFRMRMYNADGSEGAMCGNGIRCVGKYVYDRGLTDRTRLTVQTGSGVRTLELNVSGGCVESVRVDMGTPEFSCAKIPVACPDGTFINRPVEAGGRTFLLTAVSMGNPHAVTFQDSVDDPEPEVFGPMLEKNALFPARVNVEFVQALSRGMLKMRVWERGSGETLACGTGACAALAAAVVTGRSDRRVTMLLRGGPLELEWAQDDKIYMTGPAAFVFDGQTI